MDLVQMEPMRMLPIKLTLVVVTMAVNLAGGEPTGMFEEGQNHLTSPSSTIFPGSTAKLLKVPALDQPWTSLLRRVDGSKILGGVDSSNIF